MKYFYWFVVPTSIYASLALYPGNPVLCLIFSGIFCAYLMRSTKLNNFFMFYLALLMWLGFWFKLMGSLFFKGGMLFEPTGLFNYSPSQWDHALTLASAGGAGFLASSFFKNIKGASLKQTISQIPIKLRNYKFSWAALLIFATIICFLNIHYEIYQRAGRASSDLPIYFSIPIKWLLFVGLDIASVSLLYWKVRGPLRESSLYLILALFIDLLCNISTLSRAFPLTGGVIAFTFLFMAYKCGRTGWVTVLSIAILYISFSAASVLSVNFIRSIKFENKEFQMRALDFQALKDAYPGGNFLFARWLGLEGVAAISATRNLGFPILLEATLEKKTNLRPSFYDEKILQESSPYLNIGTKSYYAITLPGIVGFLSYSGSFIFIFCATFFLGVIGVYVEKLSWFFTQNTLAMSFLSFLWAYRYASFGYAPPDSYLIILSFVLVYCMSLILRKINLFKLS